MIGKSLRLTMLLLLLLLLLVSLLWFFLLLLISLYSFVVNKCSSVAPEGYQ